MLDDKDVLPICRMWARKFLRQALKTGGLDQDVFNELVNVSYAAAKPLRTLAGASTWIMWVLLEHVARPKRRVNDVRNFQSSGELDPAIAAERKEESQRLLKAVAALSDGERAIIYQYYKDNKTHAEIGKEMSISSTWVRKRIKKIVEKIRELMGE